MPPRSEKESWSTIPIGIVAWLIGITFAAGGIAYAVNAHSEALSMFPSKLEKLSDKVGDLSDKVIESSKDVEWIKERLEGCGPSKGDGAKVFVGNGPHKNQ